jgi:hypothetical protein
MQPMLGVVAVRMKLISFFAATRVLVNMQNLSTGFLILNEYLLGAGSVVGITISDDFASGCFSIIVVSGIIISGSMTDCVVSQKSDFLIWSACRFQIFPGVVSTL